MTCPEFDRLLDYADGRLLPESSCEVAAHLTHGCSRCNDDHRWYDRLLQISASDDSMEPPPWVLKRAVRLFDATRSQTVVRRHRGRIIAQLVLDSLRRPSLAGARSLELEGRQRLYRAGDYSIDLNVIVFDERGTELTGQVLRKGELMFESVGGLQLCLMRGRKKVVTTVTNIRGEFTIAAVDPGAFDLRVDVAEGAITIAGLTTTH
jgi:hypothetical protein